MLSSHQNPPTAGRKENTSGTDMSSSHRAKVLGEAGGSDPSDRVHVFLTRVSSNSPETSQMIESIVSLIEFSPETMVGPLESQNRSNYVKSCDWLLSPLTSMCFQCVVVSWLMSAPSNVGAIFGGRPKKPKRNPFGGPNSSA